jgi:hypothetical protein
MPFLNACVAALQRPVPSSVLPALDNGADLAHDGAPRAGLWQPDTGERAMKIHAPSESIFWAGAALLILALFGHFVPDSGFLAQYQFWISIAASVVVLLGCVV